MTFVPAVLPVPVCVHARRKRPPESGASVGQDDWMRFPVVAASLILAKAPLASKKLDCAIVVSKPASPSSALLTCVMTNRPEFERGHRGLGDIERRRDLGADGLGRIEDLEMDEQRPGKARAPRDDDVAVGESGDHRDAVQAGHRVGAKLGAHLRAVGAEMLHADAFVRPLVGPTTTKAPAARRASAGRISGSTSALETWASGPDSESASNVRSFSCGAAEGSCSIQATTKPRSVSITAGSVRLVPTLPGKLIANSLELFAPFTPSN